MANLTASIKRAPKWAWYASGGIALGVVGIEVWKRRAVDTPSPSDTTNDAVQGGAPTGSAAPSPVITPPVIVQQPGGDGTDFAGMFGIFGDALNNLVSTVGGLAQGDQGITSGAVGTVGDIARDVIAQAGQAPAPASQVPSIVVTVPAPTPAISVPAPAPAPAPCPSSHPHRSSQGCYRCEKKKDGTYTHYYNTGRVVGGNRTC